MKWLHYIDFENLVVYVKLQRHHPYWRHLNALSSYNIHDFEFLDTIPDQFGQNAYIHFLPGSGKEVAILIAQRLFPEEIGTGLIGKAFM